MPGLPPSAYPGIIPVHVNGYKHGRDPGRPVVRLPVQQPARYGVHHEESFLITLADLWRPWPRVHRDAGEVDLLLPLFPDQEVRIKRLWPKSSRSKW